MDCTPDVGHRAATVTFHWREHGKRLAEGLTNLFRRGCQVDTDVVLPASELSMRVHRLVLSVFLSSKIADVEGDHQYEALKLDLNDVSASEDDIRALVDFVYTGRLTVRTDQVESIRRLAKALSFEDLLNTLDNVNELHDQQQQTSIDTNDKSTTMRIDEPERQIQNDKRLLTSTKDTSQSAEQELSTDEQDNDDQNKIYDDNDDDDDDDDEQTKNPIASNKSEVFRRDLFQCPLCPFVDTSANFGAKEDLRNHFIIAHPEAKLFECHQCDFNTLSGVELEQHAATHDADDNISGRTISFDVADMKDDELERHRFQCPLCPKSFRTYIKLEHHAKRKHSKYPPAAQPEIPVVKENTAFVACEKLPPQDVKLVTDESELIQINKISDQPVEIPSVSRRGLRNGSQTRQSTIAAKIKQKAMVTCQLCHKMFTSLAFLKYHTRFKHKTVRPEEIEPSVDAAVADKEDGNYDHNDNVKDNDDDDSDDVCCKHVNNVKRYFCKWCSKPFDKRISVIFHARQKHKIRPAKERFMCHVCNKFFTRRFTLKSHLKYNHNNDDKACLNASKHTGNEGDNPACTVVNGVQGADKKREFCCNLCPLSFNLNSSLKRHRTIVHRNSVKAGGFHLKNKSRKGNAKRLSCPKCSRTFPLQCHLANHLKHNHRKAAETGSRTTEAKTTATTSIKSPRIMNVRRCNTCRLKFNDVSEYLRHLKAEHAGEKIYECSKCGFLTIIKNSMYLHLYRHRCGKIFQCDSCDHSFTMKQNLIRHCRKAHSAGVTKEHFNCSYCSMVFKSKRGVTCHIVRRHNYKAIDGAKTTILSVDNDVEMTKLKEQSDDPMDNSGDTESALLEANDEGDASEAHNITTEEERASSSTCSFNGSDGHADQDGGGGSGSVSCDANFNHRCLMCSFRTDTDQNLRLHVSNVHSDIKIFQCSRCSFWTIQERRMKAHWCRKNPQSKRNS